MNAEREVAVVTGAASGIGRAVAELLLAEGMAVVAADIDAARLEPLAERGAETLVADLGEEDGCDRVVAAGVRAGADHLVNAAGMIRLRPLFEVTRQDFRDQFRVNAESVFFLCQQLGPRLPRGGAIVNVSSVSAKLPRTLETVAYAASKTAVLSITRSFAYALAGRGVRVNAVCPGIVDTPMQDKVLDEIAALRGIARQTLSDERNATVPLGRTAPPEECARTIRALLGDATTYITGESLNVSGGMAMW